MTNVARLEKFFKEKVNGVKMASIDTKTQVHLKGGKSNPMQGKVSKLTVGSSVMLYSNTATNGYETLVKRRLEQEGKDPEEFKLGNRPWGQRVPGTPIITHNGKVYLEVIYIKPGLVTHVDDTSKELQVDQIPGYPETVISESSQGGLDKKVIIRTISMDSLINIRIDGQEYKVNDPE
jgi:hypothetical protein